MASLVRQAENSPAFAGIALAMILVATAVGVVVESDRERPTLTGTHREKVLASLGGNAPSGLSVGTGGVSMWPGERPASHGVVDWVNESPGAAPTHRSYSGMTYASGSDRVVLFSGIVAFGDSIYTDTWDNETWTYDLNTNTWLQAEPDPRPPPRGGHSMAYDAGSDRVVLFGGATFSPPGTYVGNVETWAYDVAGGAWTNLSPASHPPTMIGGRMTYDSESDRVILFGGYAFLSGSFYDRTWAYDFETNAWIDMNPSTRPPSRNYPGIAYDAESDRVILFGGSAPGAAARGDTWAYDFNSNAWTNMQPNRAPSGRVYQNMVYDSQSDRIILFGGTPGEAETWAYDFNSNIWMNMNSPAPPPGRSRHGMAYDSESDRTILFGGWMPPYAAQTDELLSDTWSYRYVANHPGAPLNLQASPGDTRVDLTWSTPPADGGSPVTNYRIYRGAASGVLSFLDEIGNVLTYSDTAVANGVTYYYAVSAVTTAGEGPLSYEVPATPGLDTISPTIVIISPSSGAILNATTVAVTGTASDDVAISKVELSLDGTNWVPATGTTSWSVSLSLAEGPNTIRARATDTSGNQAETTAAVTLDVTSPIVGISSPEALPLCTSTNVTVTGTAADNLAVEKVEVSADGVNWMLAQGTTSWSAALPLGGSTTVYVRAFDEAGNPSLIEVVHQDCPTPFPLAVLIGGVAAGAIVVAIALVLLKRRSGGPKP